MERIGTTLDRTAMKRKLTVIRNNEEPAKRERMMSEAKIAEEICSTCKNAGWTRQNDYDPRVNNKSMIVRCPDCTPYRRAKQSEALQAKLVDQFFGGSQIPFKARDWTFDTFPTAGDQEAKRQVQDFVNTHKDIQDETIKRGLYIAGPLGRAKTGLSICALKAFIEAGYLSLFVSTPELMDRLRSTFGKDSSEHEDELLKIIIEVPVLVLDDLGVEKPTPYVLEKFYRIVDKRQSRGLYTIFTSNLSTKDLEAYWRPTDLLAGAFHPGMRIIERIREYCAGISIKGKNLRDGGW